MPFELRDAQPWCPVDEESIQELLFLEVDHMVAANYWALLENRARRNRAIRVINEITDGDPVNDQYIPFLVMNYFDRYVSGMQILIEAGGGEAILQDIVHSCWRLAMKFFNHAVNTDLENHIMYALEFRMNSITPLSFIDYYIEKLNQWIHSSNTQRLARHCVTLMYYSIRVLEFRPSIIAACSILSTVPDHPQLDLMIEYIQLTMNLNQEDIVRCLNTVTPERVHMNRVHLN